MPSEALDDRVVTSARSPSLLGLAATERSELERQACAGHPHEVCGLLIGRRVNEVVIVDRLAPARNLNRDRPRDRFELDPVAFLKADQAARSAGLEVVGIWHSHPDHPAVPSRTDLAGAWEGYSYVIASVTRAGVEAVRSWRLSGDRFAEETVDFMERIKR